MSASSGIVFRINSSAFSCSINKLVSARKSILFLILLTISLIFVSPSLNNVLFVVYTTIFAPSKSADFTLPFGSSASIVFKMSAISSYLLNYLFLFFINRFCFLFCHLFYSVFCYCHYINTETRSNISFT